MARLILLGAGASHGSVDVQPSIPPLGDKLFAALEKRGGQAAILPDEIKAKFYERFELGMVAFAEHVNGNVMRFQRELAHYLAEFTPGKENIYVRLIRAVGPQRAIYSSLNYDLIFELSAASLNLNITYSAEKSDRFIRLLKIHGSSNFWPDLGGNQFHGVNFVGADRDIEAPVRPLNQIETIQKCLKEDSLSPAIAMYAEGKKIKVCRDFVDKQQKQWAATALAATKICIIGTRIYPHDDHIWGTLSKSGADIFYFGLGEKDQSEFKEWKAKSERKNIYFVNANFEKAVPHVARIMSA